MGPDQVTSPSPDALRKIAEAIVASQFKPSENMPSADEVALASALLALQARVEELEAALAALVEAIQLELADGLPGLWLNHGPTATLKNAIDRADAALLAPEARAALRGTDG
jgi:hypothetical protein